MIRITLRFVLFVVITSMSVRDARGQTPTFLLQWGSLGTGPGQFKSPSGIAVDPTGCVYVCDQYNGRVQKFDPDGVFITMWGSYGLDPGQFDIPHSIGVDAGGHVVVVDVADRVQVFTSDGVFIREWLQPGAQSPTVADLTVDATGTIYIAERNFERIEKYTLEGAFLGSVGGGTNLTPMSVAVDPAGDVYEGAALYGGDREIVKFGPDGTLLTNWGHVGTGDGQFGSPLGVAANNDVVYVADYQNDRVDSFTSAGVFLGKWGSGGTGPGEFQEPVRIALASDGAVYVADLLNNRIQKFRDASTPVRRQSWGALKAAYR